MAESIFTAQTPATGNATDSTPYELGTEFIPDVAGTTTHHRFRAPSNTDNGTSFVGKLYRVADQQLLASVTYAGGLISDDWNTAAWPSPVALSAGVRYVTAYFTPDYFVLSQDLFDSAVDNGANLVAPAAGDGGTVNGRINLAGSGFPTGQAFANSCYFSDLVFEPGAPTVDGTGLAELGGLVATGAGVRIATGVGAAALGGIAATGAGLRIVSGVGIAGLGGLSATGTGQRTVIGTGLAALGGLVATGVQTVPPPARGIAGLGVRTGPAAGVGRRTGPTASRGET